MRLFLFAAAALALVATPAAAQSVSEGCKAAMKPGWPVVGKAMDGGDWKAALEGLKPLEAACASDPQVIWLLGTVHAESDLRLGDAHASLARLETFTVPPDAFIYPANRWVYLAASEAIGGPGGFTAGR